MARLVAGFWQASLHSWMLIPYMYPSIEAILGVIKGFKPLSYAEIKRGLSKQITTVDVELNLFLAVLRYY